jgi:hypothetical protein
MDPDLARVFLGQHHRAVLATSRADGRPQLSPVTCALDSDGRVVVSTRETAVKTKNLRRDPRASLCVFTDRFFGDWVDWDDYRAAMRRDRRVIARIEITRAGPDISG